MNMKRELSNLEDSWNQEYKFNLLKKKIIKKGIIKNSLKEEDQKEKKL